jgi:hypothetical protein
MNERQPGFLPRYGTRLVALALIAGLYGFARQPTLAPELAQGVAFAAKARERAGNPAAHTELAAQAICGLSAAEAAAVTDAAFQDLPADRPGEPAFEVWRRRIQDQFRKGAL